MESRPFLHPLLFRVPRQAAEETHSNSETFSNHSPHTPLGKVKKKKKKPAEPAPPAEPFQKVPWSSGPRHPAGYPATFHPQTVPLPPPSPPCFANLPTAGSVRRAETLSSESWQLPDTALTSIQGTRAGCHPELCHLQRENPHAQE